ncbi:MAG: trehalose-6-phosphate synthase [Paracoccaceae bacterium]
MSGRLIVVSNRVPSDGPPSGGLVVALHETLQAEGGLWIGTSGETVESPGPLRDIDGDGYKMKVFDLTNDEYEGYYLSYANSVLWPLCHRRSDLISLSAGSFDVYDGVNKRLAEMIAPLVEPDDLVWVHDYHFMPLAAHLREQGVKATIGYFHHIPFPTTHDLGALPERKHFPDWIAAFDLVGLQTQNDVSTALELYRGLNGAEMAHDGSLYYHDRRFEVHSFPIGIDGHAFHASAKDQDGRALLNLSPQEQLVIGVDRLDYSKGLGNRFRAFARYLETRKDDEPKAALLQIAPPTREEVQAYQEVREELELIAGRENGIHSELGWTPIRYIHRAIPRDQLASLYRAATVGLVTPVADGMNLVAKEYVAAQDADDPGVLILSAFAGAAEQMEAALIVNPYDIEEMAGAIRQALSMPLKERQDRHKWLFKGVIEDDVANWTQSYLKTLQGIPARAAAQAERMSLYPA